VGPERGVEAGVDGESARPDASRIFTRRAPIVHQALDMRRTRIVDAAKTNAAVSAMTQGVCAHGLHYPVMPD